MWKIEGKKDFGVLKVSQSYLKYIKIILSWELVQFNYKVISS